MKYLLDTNIISELISKNPNKEVVNYIKSLNENKLYLSVITIGEIKSGIEKLDNNSKKEKLSHWLHSELLVRFENRIIDLDVDIMLEWGKVNQNLKNIGKCLPIMDSLIGAICSSKDFVLLTRNKKDFKNLDINIINPFDEL